MSDKEKEILKNLVDAVPKLSEANQSYVLGIAEGMALAKESEKRSNGKNKEEK